VIKVGELAPDFTLAAHDGGSLSIKSLRGTKVLLWFLLSPDRVRTLPDATPDICPMNGARIRYRAVDREPGARVDRGPCGVRYHEAHVWRILRQLGWASPTTCHLTARE
jgi:hypothetical protein